MNEQIEIDEFSVSTKGQDPAFVRIRYRLSQFVEALDANNGVIVSVALPQDDNKTLNDYRAEGEKMAIDVLRSALQTFEGSTTQ